MENALPPSGLRLHRRRRGRSGGGPSEERHRRLPLSGLVNNAGISTPGPLSAQPPDIVRQHFEVNMLGVVHAVQALPPLLRQREAALAHPGRIVNISSVSGRIAYPFMGSYAASKHALEALSDLLRRELLICGVDVIVIQPGAIDTPIWDKAAHIRSEYRESDYSSVLQGIDRLLRAAAPCPSRR